MFKGYDKSLYILPFDHRASYLKSLFRWQKPLSVKQATEVAVSKQVIYQGFKLALADGIPASRAGILVDEEFGAAILRDAGDHGFVTCMPVEKSGQDEFEFECGEDFARHIEEFNPTFAKVLVRYNPRGDTRMNKRQTERLSRLSDYLAKTQRLFMIELLVPPEKAQLEQLGDDRVTYERELRPRLMVETIHTLQDEGVEPDVWKVEGLIRRTDCEKVVETAQRGRRTKVGCIILGRGSNEQEVRSWLGTAAGVAGFIGFAIGRTTWWDPIAAWRGKKISEEVAAAQIAKRFREWSDLFERMQHTP